MLKNRGHRNRLAILTGSLVLLLFAGAAHANLGRCVWAEVPSPIVMPDGSSHPAGAIRVCLSLEYSPVAGLHKTYVGGEFAGMFLSRRALSEGPAEEDLKSAYFMFQRNGEGELVLLGYALPAGDRFQTFRMEDIGRKPNGSQSQLAGNRAEPEEGNGKLVLLAAITY